MIKNSFALCAILLLAMVVCLSALTGCNYRLPKPEHSESPASTTTAAETTTLAEPRGETKRFTHNDLVLDITNVLQEEKKRDVEDDGKTTREYTVYTLAPGAQVTVINADMNDGSFTDSGLPYAKWYVSAKHGAEYIPIVDAMQPFEITSDMAGIITEGGCPLIFQMHSKT